MEFRITAAVALASASTARQPSINAYAQDRPSNKPMSNA
jgi:hypothetical protein